MIEARPDWVISRQRAWGVPITVFVHKETGEVIPSATFEKSAELMERIRKAIAEKGADAWFEAGRSERFLQGLVDNPADWEQATDILDVWFDSGSTHAFTLEDPEAFPGARRHPPRARRRRGPRDVPGRLRPASRLVPVVAAGELRHARRARPSTSCSRTASSSTRRARRRCRSRKGNTMSPQDIMKNSGADILRLWVASSDYTSDIRFGPGIIQGTVESYRKLRNTLRWMLGTLGALRPQEDGGREGDAGAGAADAAPADRARRGRAQGLRRVRLQARGGAADAVHEHRPVGVLLRHPQGCALLRADLQHQAQGGAGDHRADLPLHVRCGWRR